MNRMRSIIIRQVITDFFGRIACWMDGEHINGLIFPDECARCGRVL